MAAALPESSFERMTAEAREKERLERQKMLLSLPRGKVEQQYLASVAEKAVDLREAAGDLVLVANSGRAEGAVGPGLEDCSGDGSLVAQDVLGGCHGGAGLCPDHLQSSPHLRRVGRGGGEAAREVQEGEGGE
jgi:hypothetical protein